MSQVVKSHFWQSCPLQNPVEHLNYAVRGDRSTRRGGKHVLAATAFLSLLFQDSYRIRSQGDGAVGIFRFQRGFHHLAVDSGDLPLNPEGTLFQIKVFPFQAQQLSPS